MNSSTCTQALEDRLSEQRHDTFLYINMNGAEIIVVLTEEAQKHPALWWTSPAAQTFYVIKLNVQICVSTFTDCEP